MDEEYLQRTLFTSSTKLRVSELHSLHDRLVSGDISGESRPALLAALLKTYAFYIDRQSRRAVQRCLTATLSDPADSQSFDKTSDFLQAESKKARLAPGSLYSLIELCSIYIQGLAVSLSLWNRYGTGAVAIDALLLDKFLACRPNRSRKLSALFAIRAQLRALFDNAEVGKCAIRDAIHHLASKDSLSTGAAPLLGEIAGVAQTSPLMRSLVEDSRDEYANFYTRDILGSRTTVPAHAADGLRSFFSSYVTPEFLREQIIPAFEKSVLRAPEVVLNDLVTPLIESLPPEFDLSDVLAHHLLKPLLSNTKSSVPIVREGSLSALGMLASRSSDVSELSQAVQDIIKNLKESKAVDQRSLYSSMLTSFKPSQTLSPLLLSELSSIALKETNDIVLENQARVVAKHATQVLSLHQDLEPTVMKLIHVGHTDKKPVLRRIWAMQTGYILLDLPVDSLCQTPVSRFIDSTFDSMTSSWNEVLKNPIPSAQSGLVTLGYVVIATLLGLGESASKDSFDASRKKFSVDKLLKGSEANNFFLFNPKVLAKLINEEDIGWLVRAIYAVVPVVRDCSLSVKIAWAQTVTFLTDAPIVPFRIRRRALDSLTECYREHQDFVAHSLASGLWAWMRNLHNEDRDSVAIVSKIGMHHAYAALRAICVPVNREHRCRDSVLEVQMAELIVLCRSPLTSRLSWIDMCLKAGIDPQTLASHYADDLIGQIIRRTNDHVDAFSQATHIAACSAAAELTFVAPTVMIPIVVNLIEKDLDRRQLIGIGPEEAAIYRTPDGTAFVDILAKKDKQHTPDKNVKDYKILQWEQEIRQQLVQKQDSKRKLTADEQSQVKYQLEKESNIRENVSKTAAKLRRAVGIIENLATGPPTDVESWICPVVDHLLEAINQGADLVLEGAATRVYLVLAQLISPRLGAMRDSVGVATLRASDALQIPSRWMEEPMVDLVKRLLYRVRFSGEQRQFDLISLTYILPLIELVILREGIANSTEEDSNVQITLALEFLSFHLELFSDSRLPRERIARLLTQSMERFPQHYRLLKDSLMSISRVIALDATTQEISVFLEACIVPQASVRSASLQAIDENFDLTEDSFIVEIWLACHDDDEENAEIARTIWEENSLQLDEASSSMLLPYLESKDHQLRNAAARALSNSLQHYKPTFIEILDRLENLYIETAKPRIPERDAYGMLKKMDLSDPWEARHGIALVFGELAPQFVEEQVLPFITFLAGKGPLADKNDQVRRQMVDAATRLVSLKGDSGVEKLLKVFESTLDNPDRASENQDKTNEAIIILYGALARHLDPGDQRIPKIVDRLLTTLATPSETVQFAIAGCLPPLIKGSKELVPDYLNRVLDDLLGSKKYATRRGAAYGLAGTVKGRGVFILRKTRLMSRLKAASEERKDSNQRQGAFLAYELLSLLLGPTFEPYVIQIVPQLLIGFGDSSADVREACLDASKTCFATLSSFGVKQILPTLLNGLDETQWRSKKGACDSLGAMAYLDPQQLAVSLPEIIPPLTQVLNDSHKEVRGAANRSLQRFGDVISNPEIKSLVNILLKALSDPTKYTDDALDELLKVSFVHYLDAPSLALVTRILERGLGDRSNTKRKASQIIGSLAHLTDRRDLVSHLPVLVSGLRVAAIDPVPTTRATASKALGSLVEKLGEEALPDLIPSLMSTLKTDTGAGDRLGSAQALSEVLAGLGVSRLEETLPSILQNVSSAKAAVREGFMSLFIFLPACFGNSFANYLSRIIPPILSGLADEVDGIRETSLRAGRLLVKNFATRAIDLLLPELQRGLGDTSYRIRLSSVELVGDLLFNLTGISSKLEEDEDEAEEGATAAGHSLLEALGEEKRNNILSALYISRCDTSGLVRSAAIHVWKALVASPRTLREITPTLTQVIIRRLASSNVEQKHIAGNALGELIRKAGEGVLASLLPTLEEGLETSVDADAKQGICIALRELITSATPEALEFWESKLIAVVRTAIVDADSDVREAAAEAFDSLQRIFGKRVIDHILPNLLGHLREPSEAENALAALLTLLAENTRSNIILPTLLPSLLGSPISTFNARALASLASVAGSAMTRRLSHILNALLDNATACKEPDRLEALDAAFDAVMLSVDEFDGLNTLMSAMLVLVKHDDHKKRKSADQHLANFFAKTELDYTRYYSDLIRALLISFDDRDSEVVKAAWIALSTLTARLHKEDMESLAIPTRQVLGQVGVPGHDLPGFLLPKGISAILPIFLQGLINGSPDQRTQCALAINEMIDKTSGDALRPFVTQITGPLIRVVSERSVEVKSAILLTLNHLLEKIPTFLKPFLPQLQRTFTKALADAGSETLRNRAAKALGTLITLTPRIDPLIGELVAGSKTTDPGVRNAMQKALYEAVSRVGASMGEGSQNSIVSLIDNDTAATDESTAITNARLLGALVKNLAAENAAGIVKGRILTSQITRGSILAFNAVLVESPETLTKLYETETLTMIRRGIAIPESVIAENAVLAAGKYMLSESSNRNYEVTRAIFESLVPVMQPGCPVDTRRLALVVIRTISTLHNGLVRPHLAALIPPVFAGVRDPIIPIKLSAEASFLSLLAVVDEESAVFDKYIGGPGKELSPATKRSMQDYFKRIAMRLAAQARERREAEGGQGGLGLSNDEQDDLREIWSVGKVDLGESTFEY